MKKLVSAAVFRLKGGGWYETDFKSGNKRNVTDQPSSHEEGSAAKQDNATQPRGGDAKLTDKTETTNKSPTQSGAKTTTASNSE